MIHESKLNIQILDVIINKSQAMLNITNDRNIFT
jgi:hypothetical protein